MRSTHCGLRLTYLFFGRFFVVGWNREKSKINKNDYVFYSPPLNFSATLLTARKTSSCTFCVLFFTATIRSHARTQRQKQYNSRRLTSNWLRWKNLLIHFLWKFILHTIGSVCATEVRCVFVSVSFTLCPPHVVPTKAHHIETETFTGNRFGN